MTSPAVCVGCGSPTGTVARLEGSPGWIITHLIVLGLASERAETAVSGQSARTFHVCPACARSAGLPTALDLPGLDVPVTRQQGGRP